MRRHRLHVGVRRERVAPWALLAVLAAVAGLVVTIWRPLAPVVPAASGELSRFGEDVLATVAAYRAPRYLLAPIGTALAVLVPLLFVVTGWGRRRVDAWDGTSEHGAVRAGLIALRISVTTSLAVLPLGVYIGVIHDGRWGFRTRSVPGWFYDWFLRSAGQWLLMAVLIAVLMAAVRRWPKSWPYRVTLAGTVLVAGLVLLHPLVVQPLFLPTSPLPEGPERTAIAEVAARAGASDLDIHVGRASLRSTRVNALVTGIGPTERIVVYDNLLQLPTEQITAVVAHELAHQQHADLPRGVALSAAALLAGAVLLRFVLSRPGARTAMGARSAADPRMAAVAVAVIAVLELVGTPVGNIVSRRAEAAADARGVDLTQQPGVLVATTRVFTVRDLAEPLPPTWARLLYGSHPSVAERIDYLEGWAAQRELPLPSLDALRAAEADQRHAAIDDGLPGASGDARE